VVEELKKAEIKSLKDKKWEIEKGVVMKEEWIYMLEEELRRKVVMNYLSKLFFFFSFSFLFIYFL